MPNLFHPEFEPADDDPPGFRARSATIGRQAGCERLGATLYAMPPGEAVCPYHLHFGEEELLIVVSGRPSVRTPDGWRELEAGDVVAFPVGERGAHQVANRSDEDASVLMVSEMSPYETVIYPDSGKVGVRGRSRHDLRANFLLEGAVDYWHGETAP